MNDKLEQLKELWTLYLSRSTDTAFLRPRSVTITLTSRCNLRCVMCNHWKHPTRPSEEISTEQAMRVIGQVAAWGVTEVELSGGEPMLRRDFMELLRCAGRNGLKVNVTTNGMLIPEDVALELVQHAGLRLQISLDGAKAETHDKIRGKEGSYAEILAGVKRLTEANRDVEHPIPINATTTITRLNLEELPDLVPLTQEHGFTSITFQPAVDDNLSIWQRDLDNPLRPKGKDFDTLDRALESLIEAGRDNGFVANSETNFHFIKDYFADRLTEKHLKCYSGFIACIVSPDGQIWSCMGNMGSVYGTDIRAVWNSPKAIEMRRRIRACVKPCLYPCYLDEDADNPLAISLKILREQR